MVGCNRQWTRLALQGSGQAKEVLHNIANLLSQKYNSTLGSPIQLVISFQIVHGSSRHSYIALIKLIGWRYLAMKSVDLELADCTQCCKAFPFNAKCSA
eukprot:scaffold232865_cov15-Prasinocladus_malaysianus.AAC.1